MKAIPPILLMVSPFLNFQPLMAETFAIDPVHTQVLFSVSHMGFSRSSGAFTDPRGTFEFDESDFSNSSVEVTLQSNKLDMGNATWKLHLSGVDWFNINRFPEITFKSTEVTQTGDGSMDITGDLTLLGETRSVTLNAVVNKVGDMMGKHTAGFSATTIIDRTDFGLDTFVPAIGAQVEIQLEVEGTRVTD